MPETSDLLGSPEYGDASAAWLANTPDVDVWATLLRPLLSFALINMSLPGAASDGSI